MKEKRNELWKLDLLEAKYTQAMPRFSFTKKLINARNNSHVMKKLPSTPNEAFQQIHALKADLFRKKYHGSYKKLSRDVARAVKLKKTTETEHVQKLMLDAEFLEALITAKLVKLVLLAMLTTKEAKQEPPAYIAEDVREYITDKSLSKNPSRFFINYCQNDKVLNNYLSKLWNLKEMKTLCQEIEWSFRKIRGNLTKAELAARASETGTNAKDVTKDETGISVRKAKIVTIPKMKAKARLMLRLMRRRRLIKFSAYDNMVAGSDEEQDFVADPNVDYNEITDEEMSGSGGLGESESESETGSGSESESDEIDRKSAKVPKKEVKTDKKEAKKPTKVALPQLATGYYSGGSDDEEEDVDNDKIVKEATTQRKNRRGQRARQKIWEQKYGKLANHVQKENLRIASEREQKQKEFEERQRKREMKEKLAQETNTSKTAGSLSSSGMKVHPSWEAKKLAEEKLKNVKFTGKKITFD
ncbi:hypothetical protein HF325_003075 [Metschnikowia pulcherrima]|uniref:Bud22 domain-containing protein n=1 Tax=Metschnikowia pulcherrima TaxID=27326 RepID=A0A8H7GS47_9ASCO|nr:hypothetical protein HF325_003075 [Metschnikowia pulcherrima]